MGDAANFAQRKRLGAYYTEADTANAIVRLALVGRDQTVLDPCFGGCAFLEAVRSRMAELGNRSPMRNVYGIDVDRAALKYLHGVKGVRSRQFLVKDFLQIRPEVFGVRFDVIVGNPPFVRHHLLSTKAVKTGQEVLRDVDVPKTADSWLYFFHHSLRFLRHGGSLAMVLPGSLLNAEYAKTAREAIAARFSNTELFLVRRRLFADALESPVIVIARGYGEQPQSCRLGVVDKPSEIAAQAGTGAFVDLTERTGPWRLSLLSTNSRSALASITRRADVSQLGELAVIHIGVVTGANDFFTMTRTAAKERGLSDAVLREILTTTKQFSSLEMTAKSMRTLLERSERVLLLDTNGSRTSIALQAYLDSPAAKVAQRAFKCRDREPWHALDDLRIPHAFLSYVVDRVPRLVLNRSSALCTNAIHRVWWRARSNLGIQKGRALSVLSSLGGLSAEIYGRVAGGGALKLEPGEAAALWMPSTFRRLSVVDEAFDRASLALGKGEWQKARSIADRAILKSELNLVDSEIHALRDGHDALLASRFSLAARATKRAV